MATGPKPRHAAGYSADATVACERALVTLLGAFGSLKTTLRLVGGLVPRYLTPEAPPDVPAHAGTSDVDVVLNLQVIAEGEGYASLADQLKARGFERYVNENGKATAWRWKRIVDEHTYVLVEFLRDAGTEPPGKAVSVDGERVSAMAIEHAGIVHDWFEQREIGAELLDEGGFSTETIRFADVPAFILLKALAFDHRLENKDAADLIHVMRYAGPPEDIARRFAHRLASGLHRSAIDAGLQALERRFCDGGGSEGHRKAGPVSYGAFFDHVDDDARVLAQRYAAGLVTEVLRITRMMTPT
ncbi:hypothetical protein BH11PSE9_BH11PSE9_22530 [soil metagenome]